MMMLSSIIAVATRVLMIFASPSLASCGIGSRRCRSRAACSLSTWADLPAV